MFTGAPESLRTGVPLEAANTVPLILTVFVGSLTALEVIVTDLLIGPVLLVSYFTFTAEV